MKAMENAQSSHTISQPYNNIAIPRAPLLAIILSDFPPYINHAHSPHQQNDRGQRQQEPTQVSDLMQGGHLKDGEARTQEYNGGSKISEKSTLVGQAGAFDGEKVASNKWFFVHGRLFFLENLLPRPIVQ